MSLTCEIALINSPNQVVVSGNAVILKELRDALKV
jgi:malonyl CoA-acyl carrier protein transacylase